MFYKFMKDGKQVNSAITDKGDAEAVRINGGIEYDTILREPNNEGQPTEKKTRKPRSDKGIKRITANSIIEAEKMLSQKTPKEKSRKKPKYYILIDDKLDFSGGTHDEALKQINLYDKDAKIKIIIGHEISFRHEISFTR